MPTWSLRNLALLIRMDDEYGLLTKVRLHLEPLADFIRGLGVLGHHEQQRIAPHVFQGFTLLPPLLYSGVQLVSVAVSGVIGGVFDVTREFSKDGTLYDTVLNRLGNRVVDNNLVEQGAVRVLRRGGEVDLRTDPGSHSRAQITVHALDNPCPLKFVGVEVMALVVEYHKLAVRQHPLPQPNARSFERARPRTAEHGRHLGGLGSDACPASRLVQLVDVREVEGARCRRHNGIVTAHYGELPV